MPVCFPLLYLSTSFILIINIVTAMISILFWLVQEGRDKRFLIQKLCQAQKRMSGARSSASNSSQERGRYHRSHSREGSGVFLVQQAPDSVTQV